MITTVNSFLALTLLAQCITAQSSAPTQFTYTSDDNASSLGRSSTVVTSVGLSGIPLATSTSRQQNATTTFSTTTKDLTAIVGLHPSTVPDNGTASATTSAQPRPSNTRPCNGHVEFCRRRFSNVSMVVAHNSPFVREHNAASNQIYPVLNQLNDGIRGLQFETQQPNSTSGIRLCHTSCNLLDVGTLESYLATVKGWLDEHPYEVLGIIMGNNNGQSTRIPATDYIAPFQDSGIMEYVWTPSESSLDLDQWPTLGELIIRNKRVVVMLDYGTDQDQVPWLLSEFNYMWETPFSPTDPAFPCTQQRPPDQAEDTSRARMYMMNHNLNVDITIASFSILVPAYSLLDQVNADAGNGSVGLSVHNCTATWGRPPNWILVDYYNFGNFNGSVFEVAAVANGVSYERGKCCGSVEASAATILRGHGFFVVSCALVAFFMV